MVGAGAGGAREWRRCHRRRCASMARPPIRSLPSRRRTFRGGHGDAAADSRRDQRPSKQRVGLAERGRQPGADVHREVARLNDAGRRSRCGRRTPPRLRGRGACPPPRRCSPGGVGSASGATLRRTDTFGRRRRHPGVRRRRRPTPRWSSCCRAIRDRRDDVGAGHRRRRVDGAQRPRAQSALTIAVSEGGTDPEQLRESTPTSMEADTPNYAVADQRSARGSR